MSFSDEFISTHFQDLTGLEFSQILFYLMIEKTQFSLDSHKFCLNIFVEDTRSVIQILDKILGK